MRYYPVFADIKGRPAVVIGGGPVAERKVESLLGAGASVTVISPVITKGLASLSKKGQIRVIKRKYKQGDLKGSFIAVSASNVKAVNRAVYAEAQTSNILLNVVDDPELCNFIVPSVVDRGSLIIAISTSGRSPLLAKTLRQELEKTIGPEYAILVEIAGELRKNLLKTGASHVKKERVINDLLRSPALELIRGKKLKELDGLIEGLLGRGWSLKRLGINIKEADRPKRRRAGVKTKK